nr:MAG TPA: major capsid protein [Caudoviricetes sp.]
MAYNVLEQIDARARFDFSQNFDVKRPTVLDTIFPDIKTDFWEAEYYRLMSGQRLPVVAHVHALDTEAEIGSRPGFEKVLIEEFLIKRKINQSEKLRHYISKGVAKDEALTRYVYGDAARQFESVLARTYVMKGEILSKGTLTVKENNLDISLDIVPSTSRVTLSDWSQPNADIPGDIQKLVDLADDNGYTVNRSVTSKKMIGYMKNNVPLQSAILGTNNIRLLTNQELANFLSNEYQLELYRCDEKYRFEKQDKSVKTGRYFAENAFTVYEAEADGSCGTGLWGPTPEEEEYRGFVEQENRSYITLSMWATHDPVATWTKASGMFVPVVPKANGGIIIGTKGE